nr:TonB-dependent receptor [uncultured Carboxylicivirga sp.]
MSKKIMLLLCMSIFWTFVTGQNRYILKGSVVDDKNIVLTGAAVVLHPVEAGTVSDYNGNFEINNLLAGTYTLEVSFIGHRTLIDTLTISKNRIYNARLKCRSLNLQEVVIKDHYADERKREESLNIEVVNDDYLKQNMGGSLMKSLERLPGVSTIDIGSGQSKPVIRGLGFNRVVVVENNIKHEGQQWGEDHGLEVDQYSVDNIEVIKGPASLMYGSDAIGGVIDMNNRKIPTDNSFGGRVDLTGKSNNNLVGGSLSVFGRKKWFFAEFRATILDYGDYRVPTDSVEIYSYKAALHKNYMRNTAGKEHDFHLSLGIVKNRFQSRFYISNIHSKNGFFANAHGLEPRNVDTELHDRSNRDINDPYQEVNHFKVINTSKYQDDKLQIETNLGYQINFREEWSVYTSHGYMPPVFPDTLSFNPRLERQFDKSVYTANAKAKYQVNEATQLALGFNGEYQNNQIDGRGFIIPAYQQLTLGGFAFAKHKFSDKSMMQMGVRYDYGSIKTNQYNDWFPSPEIENGDTTWVYLQRAGNIDRNFPNFTWSVGYNYNAHHWSFKANLGKSFRMPIAKELAANGVNYHRFSYEVGDPDLSPEISYQLDLGLEYFTDRWALGATPFLNYFSNYIYLNPTSEHDRLYGNGNQIFNYTESQVFRYGTEIHAHYEILKSLQLGLIGEYVYSEQLSGAKKGFTLPFSPPASAIFNIKYRPETVLFLKDSYLSVDVRLTSAQNNIVPPEKPTDGSQVVNVGFGGTARWNKQPINLSLQVQNILNSKYFNHTSYYRLINVPEPGRNFVLNISVPF